MRMLVALREDLASAEKPSIHAHATRSLSTTGNAKPARCKRLPSSRMSANGATRGEIPPSTSLSAAANAEIRSGCPPPINAAAITRPVSVRRIWISAPGRSLTNCSASADTTRSSESSANGKGFLIDGNVRPLSSPSSPADDNADILCSPPARDDGIGWRTEINGHVELAQDRGKPLAQLGRNAIQQNVAGVNRRARFWRTRSNRRSRYWSLTALLCPIASARSCHVRRYFYRCSMNELVSATGWRAIGCPLSFLRAYDRRYGSRSTSPCPSFVPFCPSRLATAMGSARIAGQGCHLSSRPTALGSGFRSPTIRARPTVDGAIANPPAYDRPCCRALRRHFSRALIASNMATASTSRRDDRPKPMARAGRELLSDAKALVPAPLHWRRQWARRFNQSATLAGVISGLTGVPVVHGGLNVCGRRRNRWASRKRSAPITSASAFRSPWSMPTGGYCRAPAGLIDDVLTSGTTVMAAPAPPLRGLWRQESPHIKGAIVPKRDGLPLKSTRPLLPLLLRGQRPC